MHFTVTIYYNIISKFQKIAKNSKMVRSSKKSKGQVSDIMLDASMKFQNYPIKTVGKMHFTVTIYYTIISKFQKFAKNTKIIRSSKKAQARLVTSYLIPVLNLEAIRPKL